LGAELIISNIVPRFIGLTATLRPEDVADVLKRQSIKQAVVYRVSCHREELKFQFITVKAETTAIEFAVKLAISKSHQTTVLVYGTTIKLCETIGDQIKAAFRG
jgi:superfamily II DNA helicase RecQ